MNTKNYIYQQLQEEFDNTRDVESILHIDMLINDLHKNALILCRKYNFARPISRFVDEIHDQFLILIEHAHYNIRVQLCVQLSKGDEQQLNSLRGVWETTEIWEYSTYYKQQLLFKPSNFLFKKSSEYNTLWEPASSDVNGNILFHYNLDEKNITDIYCDITNELPSRKGGLESRLELNPYYIQRDFSMFRYSFTMLYYQSIEQILDIEVQEIDIIKKMLLIELERLEQVMAFFDRFCRDRDLSIVMQLIQDWHKKFSALMFENNQCSFGFFYPRLAGNKLLGEWLKEIYSFLKYSEIILSKIVRVIRGNSFFISNEQLFTSHLPNLGLDGILAKANGAQHDIRFTSSYYFYRDLGSSALVGSGGTPWDIIIILFEEFRQSVGHLRTLIKGIPLNMVDEQVALLPLLEDFDRYAAEHIGETSHFGMDSLVGENSLWWQFSEQGAIPTIQCGGFGNLSLFMLNSRHRILESLEENLPLWMIDVAGALR